MADFNTTELKKLVSLSVMASDVDLPNIKVKNATYDGDTYPEGVIPLKTAKDRAVDLRTINKLQ